MNGFLIIDKPSGITSHDVVSRVRRIIGSRKVGHTGTLDPFATGVLPIAINDGTKAINYLDEGFKQYEAVMRLGCATDTLDMTGTVLKESDPSSITPEMLEHVCSLFTGAISQIPPMYSALKQNGQPLYKLARQGVEVARPPRDIQVFFLEILSVDMPLVTFRVDCSRGTYVRTLADDMGQKLGCGAALQELRRTASGLFRIEAAVTLNELESCVKDNALESILFSPYAALGHLPDIVLTPSGLKKLSFGVAPDWSDTFSDPPHTVAAGSCVRLSTDSALAAVAELHPQPELPPRIVLRRVFV